MLTTPLRHMAPVLAVILLGTAAVALPVSIVTQLALAQPARAYVTRAQTTALRGGALATFAVQQQRFRVWVTNPESIQQLKDLRAGTSHATIPTGRIRAGPGKGGHNKPWRWHLDPRDVRLSEMTTEVCDGTPSYVNAHLGYFLGTVKRYCPWGAKLVALRVTPPVKPVIPAMPADLRVVSTTSDSTSARKTTVRLAWQDRSSNVTGFRIRLTETRFYGGQNLQTQDEPANTTVATITFVAGGINPTKEACFTVTAFNAVGESPPAGPVCMQP